MIILYTFKYIIYGTNILVSLIISLFHNKDDQLLCKKSSE